MSFENVAGTPDKEQSSDCEVIQDALTAIRQHLGMEVAYFSEFVDGRSVFRRVDAPGLEHLIKVGDSHSLDDVYCNHILEGRLPQLIPDTSSEPLALSMPITGAVPIGSHASIPIRLPDGQPFGMFCCLSPTPNLTLNERDLQTMKVFAGLATRQLHLDIEQGRVAREKRAAVEAIIDRSELDIVFQPIFDLMSSEISSVEALCRFRPLPYRSPDKWFQDAADVGRGVDLELRAIQSAIAFLDALPHPIAMSINASPETVVSGRLAAVLEERLIGRIVLEITEHARVEDYVALHHTLDPLRKQGMQVAIDDAGAGYSGLQHIVQMAPDVIKLDMSLTRRIDQDSARRALASAMIFYARETGSVVVAEGIETSAELRTLKMLGVSKGQGYLLGKPARLEAVIAPADTLAGSRIA
ncbi:sensor domain-containing phosphodiesterase [Pararhizobium haloflavum]|uniref:sensor domain-containing phosphodiesterase n=1 Tax=Pararhizobium haloflavum TaxID=2037914 RepID=UPI000C1937EB|nr:EAL domain-containing protein [Pararhizobium haloflavum]